MVSKIFDDLSRVDRGKLDQIVQQYPNIPRDYLDFLGAYGCGEIGSSNFMIYEGPIPASEIYSGNDDVQDEILLFGDDFAGYTIGVDLSSGSLVELDGFGRPTKIESSLADYLGSRLGFLNS